MISQFLPDAKKAELNRYLGPFASRYVGAFQEGLVRVFYSFTDGALAYEAYWNEEYGRCSFRVNGRFNCLDNKLSAALALFVCARDASDGEETLRKRYGVAYSELKSYVDAGPKKANALYQANQDIENLAEEIELDYSEEKHVHPTLRFYVEPDRLGGATISLRLGFDKLYLNRKVGEFLKQYYSGGEVMIQKEMVTLPRPAFSEAVESALQILLCAAAKGYNFNSYYPIGLTERELMELFFTLQGEIVTYDGLDLRILPKQDIRLRIDEQGVLRSSADTGIEFVQEGKRAYAVEKDGIHLFEFVSSGAASVYRFYREKEHLDPSFLAGAMAKRILPLLRDQDIELNDQFLEKHPIVRSTIRYYVSLADDKTLHFETRYFQGETELTQAEFLEANSHARKRYSAFKTEVESLGLSEQGNAKGEESVVNFLKSDLTKLRELCEVYVSEDLQSRHVSSIPDFSLRTSSGEDWFSVQLYSSGYTEDELLALYGAYQKKKKFVRLRDNYILLDGDDERMRRLAETYDVSEIGVELPLYQALKLPQIGGDMDQQVHDLLERVSDFSSLELPQFPPEMESFLRPYQKNGARFLFNLYRLNMSGILSDDMGLGKTLQSFALFYLMQTGLPILVVCPKSLIFNWLEERNRWYPSLPADVLIGSPKERQAMIASMTQAGKKVYFVSYDTLRNDIEHIKQVKFAAVLLDEGQYIANAKALKSRAVKSIQANTRFVLTGTPVQNSLMDLWSIFDFLLPGYFPPLTKFHELYGGLEFASDEARARLLAKIKPFLLGRKKKDVLAELPDKENITMSLAMAEDQRKAYEVYLAKARIALEEKDQSKIALLAMMTRLRQICVTPALFLEGSFSSGKIDYLIDTLSDLHASGRKAIVFSSFVGALKLIGQRCKEAGLTFETITGDTAAKMRVILANRFNKEDSPIDVMLVSLKAGGTGLNLIGADTVFHLDPWWNIAAETQAEDRAHRIGQTRKVTVFKLVVKDSIEEKVLSLQEKKGRLVDLTDEASLESVLTDEDYRYLLS